MKNKANVRICSHYLILTAIALAVFAATNALADKYKANNTVPLNRPRVGPTTPCPPAAEFAVWDSTVTAANTTNSLGGSMTWGGIKILNPGGPVTLASGNTLTLQGVGGIGIDMSGTSQNLTVNCALSLPARPASCPLLTQRIG